MKNKTEKRAIIDMLSLKIYRSLGEASKDLHKSRQCIFAQIESNGFVSQDFNDNKRKEKGNYRLEYLENWITNFTDDEKRKIFNENNVDFYIFN